MNSKMGHLFIYITIKQASLVAQTERNLPAMQADAGLIPGSGRSPGERMATHSSILDWRIPWTEEPGRPQSMRLQRVRHDWATDTFNSLSWFPTVGAIASSWGQQPSHRDGVLGKMYRNPHWLDCFWIQCLHGAEIISKAHRGQCSKDV